MDFVVNTNEVAPITQLGLLWGPPIYMLRTFSNIKTLKIQCESLKEKHTEKSIRKHILETDVHQVNDRANMVPADTISRGALLADL